MPPKKRKEDSDSDVQRRKYKKKGDSSNGDSVGASAAADNDLGEEDEGQQIILEGSLISGELLFCGGTNWDLIGRHNVPKGVKNLGGRNIWSPHRIAGALDGVRVRTIASGPTACHSIVITTEGKAYSWGRNDKGQLGQGDTIRRDAPTLIESLSHLNIVDAACGKNHTVMLSEHGHVYAFGDNKMGQLGLGHQSAYVPSPTRISYKGPPIRKIACGAEFSMIANVKGHLYSFGNPEYGQLGHNTDGKYFVSGNKIAASCELRPRLVQIYVEKNRDGTVAPVHDVEVTDIACGTNHTAVIDRKKRVFTWGFGGYGRLGHSEPKDEMVPRLNKFFEGPNRGAKNIVAGSSFTMAVNEIGMLYLWGQNKPTGEAAMYPKPVSDLNGWQIRSIGCCNRSIVIAADDSLISWGPSPTYGELGYGENKPKSSTMAQEVKSIFGVHVNKVACGYGHTLLMARVDSDEDREKIKKLPVLDQSPPPTEG